MFRILLLLVVLSVTAHAQQKTPHYQSAKDSANIFMRAKSYDKALASFKKSFKRGNTNLIDFYNAACAASLTQKPDEAFMFLDKSIEHGYLDKPWAENDSDFDPLHGDSRWAKAMKKLEDQPRVEAKKFAGIKTKDPATLIPFKQNGFWGYLDKESLTVVVKPEFVTLPFMNGCAEVTCYDGTRLFIDPSGELMSVVHRDHSDRELMIGVDDSESIGPFPISSADGFKGFKMDANNKITHFSDIYDRVEPHFFNISGPFMIDGKYYAVAEKGDASGVIDEEGNSLPGFDFVHDQLALNGIATVGDTWFYYKDKDGKAGFVNHKGQKKMEGELFDYPYLSSGNFDYGVQRGEKIYGVLDIQKMEWLIKPQPLYIQRVLGTTKAPCKKFTEERKDMIDAYFLVHDEGAEPDEYYVDRNLKVYKPKR